MINYVQNKRIDSDLFSKFLFDSQKTNQFTNNGPAKFILEKKLEEILEIDDDKTVLCTANGTLAWHAIYLFLRKKNYEHRMVTPSFTFPSCVTTLNKIKILDIDEKTHTLPLTEKNLIENDVFVITNLFGTYPNNLEDWISSCKEMNKVLIFDNASSPMTKIDGVNICNFGDFSFGSLHHTKFLGFGEGGFIVLKKNLYREFERILGFGFSKTAIKRKYDKFSSNLKMSDISAAAILQHIERYKIEDHERIQSKLVKGIRNLNNVELFNFSEGVIYGNLPIIYNDKFDIDFFRINGVEAQKYYYPLREHKNSLSLFDRIINIPLHSDLNDHQVDKIINLIERSTA